MNTSWHSYPSIYALGHNALGELLMDPVLIEEKVDGSQFSFGVFEENGERVFRCRSKGCIMVPDAPEKMFQAAVDTARALPLRPGWTYRAEYLAKPKHNVLAYARTPKDHLIIFDINDAEESYLGYDEKAAEAARLGLEVVPRLFEGALTTLDTVLPLLDTPSVLEGQKIEGFVIKNYSRFGRDKKVLMGKFVCAEFKESHSKEWKLMNPTKTDIVDALIAGLKTDARFHKAVQHLRESGAICGEPRDIGALIKEVQADIEKECEAEIKDALFKYALPKIRRGVVAGLPEWYKSQLAQSQFS